MNLSPAEMEWDTCAPEVVLTEAGCTVTDGDGRPFRYNQKDLYRRRGSVASNGKCHSLMLRVMAPCLPEPAPPSRVEQPSWPLEHAEQQHEAGDQHGDAGREHDQQQALRARAGGGAGERDVGDDEVGILRQRPAEQDEHRLRRRRERAPDGSGGGRARPAR